LSKKDPIFEDSLKKCLQDEPAFCEAACPFDLDIRDFIDKIKRGGFTAAYRSYQAAVLFPKIVSAFCKAPCRAVCIRNGADGFVDLQGLERAAVQYTSHSQPTGYSVPPKSFSVAVIGAGVSGLACALRLAEKQFPVTVYERSAAVGGQLRERPDSELWLEELCRMFVNVRVEMNFGQDISSLDSLNQDAVYIATGPGGTDFGLKAKAGNKYCKNKYYLGEGRFWGGQLIGSDLAESIADGLRAASLIEIYSKVKAVPDKEYEKKTALVKAADAKTADAIAEYWPDPRVRASRAYTKEEAAAEAARCLKCRCDGCIKNCDLMEYYNKRPRRIKEEVDITIEPASIAGRGTLAKRLIGTCNMCGNCRTNCPESIDVGRFLLESRREMHKRGTLPWPFYYFWIRDMRHAQSGEAALVSLPQKRREVQYLFFPGCQLGASDPRYVEEVYENLRTALPGTGIWLSCCGAPAVWAGDETLSREVFHNIRKTWEQCGKPVLLLSCPTCRKMLAEYLPEIPAEFVYPYLKAPPLNPSVGTAPDAALTACKEPFYVFDPCSSQEWGELRISIRRLMKEAGLTITAKQAGFNDLCCSWGGQVSVANPSYAKYVIDKRIKASEEPFLTYCANCRDVFAAAGKEVVHIFDILSGRYDLHRPAPDCNERRDNRARLKKALLKKYGDGKMEEDAKNHGETAEHEVKIIIPEEVLRKISSDLILAEEVRETVRHCEKTGRTLTDVKTGIFSGYKVVGSVTCWVEYLRQEAGITVQNAYSHRMSIKLEDAWRGRKINEDMQRMP